MLTYCKNHILHIYRVNYLFKQYEIMISSANFNDMYAKCPDLFHKYMEEISQTMVDSDNTSLIMFFYHVGVNNAQVLFESHNRHYK